MSERHPSENRAIPATALQMAYYRALESANFKGGFLMRTAHELRSPLNQIISLQQMIIEGLCDDIEEEHQFVADAYAASLKLLEYLDLMIRVSKIEMGRLTPQLQPVAVAATLQQVQTLTQLQVADRNLRLTVELPAPTLTVLADPDWLRNILTTLIEMAVAGGDRGTLQLDATLRNGHGTCDLWLTDDRSTSPWQEPTPLPPPSEFTLDDTLSTSLRLSLVYAMTEALGGQFTLAAPAEKSDKTRLQISLPLADAVSTGSTVS